MSIAATRSIVVGRRRVPVVLPSSRDARLRQSAVLLTLQVLGQTVLGFDLSVAQILASITTCAALEIAITAWRSGVLAWPASALLTGNGVALLLRVPGTKHGDWWSMRGWWLFVAVGAASLLSKYAVRVGGTHVFNPSNIGLVGGFLLLGAARVDAQVLWWGDLDGGLAAAVVLILVGGTLVIRPLGLLPLALCFFATFAALVGILVASGHCMTAAWRVGPVCGATYWWSVVLSPELFVFAMFMITDPRTTPATARARRAFGVGVGALAAVLVAPQRTEFATKVAILGSLAVVCASVPVLRAVAAHRAAFADLFVRRGRRLATRLLGALVIVAAVPTAGAAARPSSFTPRDIEAAGATRPPLPPGSPVVSLDSSVGARASWYTIGSAERRALDIVADLDILAHALRLRDPELAAAAAVDERLADTLVAIHAAAGRGRIEIPRHHVTSIVATMVRVPRSRQPSPEVGFIVAGDRTTDVVDLTSSPPAVIATRVEPFRELVRMRPNPTIEYGRYLIAGPGETWT